MIELYQHQKEALEKSKGLNRVAYYYDMGLGKTFIGSEKMIQLGANINLLICQKSKIDDWVQHFRTHYNPLIVWNLTDKIQLDCFLSSVDLDVYAIGIINYELAWRRTELLQLKDFTLMLDESSLIQNSKAKQTKFVLKLKPANVILLSGTPCSGKYEALWSQAKLLGWKITESKFNEQYVNRVLMNFGGAKIKIVDKKNPYKNVDELKQNLSEHGAFFKRTEECFDLPDQVFQEISVPVIPAYKQFMKDRIVTVDGVELIGDTVLTKILYARMLCGAYNKHKIEAVKDLIQSTNDRLIIFYNFNIELDALETMCKALKRPYSVVNGSVKDLTAYKNESDSITLCQFQAASKGLNLQLANKILYFSPTQKCEDWMQSKKRIHRIGQKRPCIYYMVTCKGSIEKSVYKALQRGTDYTNELFQGEYK